MKKLKFTVAAAIAGAISLLPISAVSAVSGVAESVTDPTGDGQDAASDIVAVDLAFGLETITITVDADGAMPAFSDSSWAHGGDPGRYIIAGLQMNEDPTDDWPMLYIDGDSAAVLKDLDEELCPATASIVSGNVEAEFAASCFGNPGVIGLLTGLGDGDLLDESTIDYAPNIGTKFTASVGGGYYMLGRDGGIFAIGGATFYGSTGGEKLNAPVVDMANLSTNDGYRFAAGDGGVFNYGAAEFEGSMGGSPLNSPVVGIANTHTGDGYWLVASDGGVFAFGDAAFHGSMGGQPLNAPIVDIVPTPTGDGYLLVAGDGGIFAFGDADFYGSLASVKLNKPIVDVAVVTDGYYMVASDGGVFAFGDATFRGTGQDKFDAEIVGITATNDGYRLVDADGSVVKFGDIYGYADLPWLDVQPAFPITGLVELQLI